jgi:hypothetical protein
MTTKKASRAGQDELRPEYDLSKLGRGVRGKYLERAVAGTNLVLIEPELAERFPTQEAVNEALRKLVEVAEATAGRGSRGRRGVSGRENE